MSDASSLGGSSITGAGAVSGQQQLANADCEALAATLWAQLWDKAPIVSAHTSRGIDFLERYGHFIKERAQIEEEYAAKLKNLTKKSRGKKADDEEFRMFITASAFQAMLNELESFASQHEVIGERLRGELLPQLLEKCRQLRAGRKKHSQDFETMEKSFQARVEELAKQKRNYEKAYQDAASAHVKYHKAEKNMNLSRLEVEKAKQNANAKSAICEQSKQGYAAQLSTTNNAKFEHFNILLPQLLEDMRRLDIDRINFTKHAMLESVKAETGVISIIQRCYTDMNTAIGTIDPDKDTHVVVEQTKTGYSHPQDFIFEDLGCPSAVVSDDSSSFDGSTMKRAANGKGIPRKQSIKMFSGPNNGKTNGTANSQGPGNGTIGEYGNLPPQQRCRRIQNKLDELAAELDTKQKSQRMHAVYTQNPKLGDAQDVTKQLEQNRFEMEQLRMQISRFQKILLDAQSELNQPLGGVHSTTITNSSTIGSSPGSSPRGSAGGGSMLTNNTCSAPRINGGGPIGGGPRIDRGSSYSEASSISSVDCASSITTTQQHQPSVAMNGKVVIPQMPPTNQTIHQTASTISTSGFSTTNSNNVPTPVTSAHAPHTELQQIQHIDADFYEECDGPTGKTSNAQHSDLILGTALAIYPYDAAQDEAGGTTISMREGEEVLLLERDLGDGWTRVRHQRTSAEGFVPTSYLECRWYPTH